jgi:hypothetical protein
MFIYILSCRLVSFMDSLVVTVSQVVTVSLVVTVSQVVTFSQVALEMSDCWRYLVVSVK